MLSALQEHVSRIAADYWHRSNARAHRPHAGVQPGLHNRAEPGREGNPASCLSKGFPSKLDQGFGDHGRPDSKTLPQRFPLQRPEFLLPADEQQLWEQEQQEINVEQHRHQGEQREETQQQHDTEPDGCPGGRATSCGTMKLPWGCGYAEAMNHNKSLYNEDQATCLMLSLEWPSTPLQAPTRAESQDESEAPFPPGHVSDHSRDDDLFLLAENFEVVSRSAAASGAAPHPAHDSQTPRSVYDGDTERSETAGWENLRNTGAVGEALPYWALFDGHGGPAVAVAAAKMLHNLLHEALQEVAPVLANECPVPLMVPGPAQAPLPPERPRLWQGRAVSRSDIIVGAIESAFFKMDQLIESEHHSFDLQGGCTALVALCALGRLYVANAGDSRAVVVGARHIVPMSHEFTPMTERQRLQHLASQHPELLGELFTPLEFGRRVLRRELGMKVLFRAHHMTGWAYKTATQDDLRFPLISGVGKQARLFSTIGVTRGFGNHDLLVHDTDIRIKPFLSSVPEVMVRRLSRGGAGGDKEDEEGVGEEEEEVLVMGTDGLWDALDVDKVASVVRSVLRTSPPDDPRRFRRAAVALVRSATRPQGSPDDVSVFVIPLRPPSPHVTPSQASYPKPPNPGPPAQTLQPESQA